MAQTSRKKTAQTSVKKSGTSSRKPTGKKKKIQEDTYSNDMMREVILLFTFASAVVAALSNFGVCGAFGRVLSGVMFGIFGIAAYVFPLYLFLGAAFLISNHCSKKAIIKFFASVIIFLFACMLLQMLFVPFRQETKLLQYYVAGREKHQGGGWIGGAFSVLFRPFLGTIGSYIIAVICIIGGTVLVTERSFIKGVKKSSSYVYQTAKDDAKKIREANRERASANREKRMDKKRRGVAIPEIIVPEPLENDVHEITDYYKEENPASDFFEEYVKEEAVSILKPEYASNVVPFEAAPPISLINDPDNKKKEKDRAQKKRKEDVQKVTPIQRDPEEKIPVIEKEEEKEEAKIALDQEEIIGYQFPPISLLTKGTQAVHNNKAQEFTETARKLQTTLKNFGVGVTITNVSCGPSVTRYELQPEQGVKVSKIVSLSDDIKLNLAAADIRIEAPIPGKAAVGIEVPNKENTTVMLRDLLETSEFTQHTSKLAFAVGKDIAGQPVVADIARMPHLLIAGATGSGKSVCINTLIMSILYKADPNDVKLIMVDPKVVELSVYNGIPHLLIPVVTDPKKAAGALNWAVAEMTDRYKKFADYNVRDLKGYNEKIKSMEDIEEEGKPEKLPQIIIIVDELADLMMVAPGEVEDAICRLAQMARAAGLHLVIATQRPSVNVITGLIKANVPSRIAFSVSSGVDSRTIIDMNGAEKLLGKGDMLFYPSGYQKPVRVQGAFVSDREVAAAVEFLSQQASVTQYNEEMTDRITNKYSMEGGAKASDRDDYFEEAGQFIISKEKASIGMLQRMFKIGFNRAARIMDQLGEAGVVGPEEGTKPRKILMTMEEFEQFLHREEP